MYTDFNFVLLFFPITLGHSLRLNCVWNCIVVCSDDDSGSLGNGLIWCNQKVFKLSITKFSSCLHSNRNNFSAYFELRIINQTLGYERDRNSYCHQYYLFLQYDHNGRAVETRQEIRNKRYDIFLWFLYFQKKTTRIILENRRTWNAYVMLRMVGNGIISHFFRFDKCKRPRCSSGNRLICCAHFHAASWNILLFISSCRKLSRWAKNKVSEKIRNVHHSIKHFSNNLYSLASILFPQTNIPDINKWTWCNRHNRRLVLGSCNLYIFRHNSWSIIRNHKRIRIIKLWIILHFDMLLHYRHAASPIPRFHLEYEGQGALVGLHNCLHYFRFRLCCYHFMPELG